MANKTHKAQDKAKINDIVADMFLRTEVDTGRNTGSLFMRGILERRVVN